ncbi:ABC transporter ATP-binding protein [Rhodococcus sp. D2-41]|uniref:ABC transporter ATP-binding protein/permease n=1 Tax=Speluncibacter jeojiensis TaxID=2710754 RepID=A0A9X4M372_9ACTN|nr:ABC transporter ATP-binding protein [Rhodococcus sp. D2-41]MDG3011156.1 ABC transporter ATP-binding protein [Rhodococcus sp. D2-41]MDG3015992.1 ABC transporter ATP-binding protein/permease [Corynebacteriales bacterium D3-21]
MLTAVLRTYLRPYRLQLSVVIVLQLAASITALFLPTLNARLIDDGVAKGDTGFILSTGGVMVAITFGQILCTIGAVYFGARASMGFGRDLRAGIYHAVGGFSDQEFSSFGAPSLITRNTNDVNQVQMLVMLTCTMLVSAPLMCIGGVVMALRENLDLSWLLAVSVPLLLLAITLVITRMVPLFRQMQKLIDAVNRVLREQLTGLRVVRAFVREPLEGERFAKANSDLTETALQIGRYQALMFPIVMLIVNVSSVAVLWFGAHLIDDGSLQIGQMSAFLNYLMQILVAVLMATVMAVLIPRAAVCADRIKEVLDTVPAVDRPAQPQTPATRTGTVELRGAQFSYPGAETPVLTDLDLTCAPGTVTAIVGSTGSGKSTLVGLIPRLFDVTGGQVLVDGIDVRLQDQDELCARIGLVPQQAYLFSGTIASNLRYGKRDATDEELWEALRIAQADDFVAELAEGLEAPVAQGGTNFSGGQRQRLAIARAVVRRPQIYVFDDSFSALDLGTDARLRHALRPTVTEATVIIVGQRVSTIADADQILVLEDGVTVGLGRHEELVRTCPTYGEIVRSQLPAELSA